MLVNSMGNKPEAAGQTAGIATGLLTLCREKANVRNRATGLLADALLRDVRIARTDPRDGFHAAAGLHGVFPGQGRACGGNRLCRLAG